MQIRINNASNRPVYQQIIDQVKRDIALGRLIKDEKLPTVRQLARQLAINPNTIAKAYRQLEGEGIIVTRPGSGAFIANLDSNLSRATEKDSCRMSLSESQLRRSTCKLTDKHCWNCSITRLRN